MMGLSLNLSVSLAGRFQPLNPPPPNGLEELVFSDFRNGVYRIGGVTKTLADLWHEDNVNWGPFDPANDVVAGTGLIVGEGNTQTNPILDTTLTASLLASGFTVVIEAGSVEGFGIAFDLVDLNAFAQDLALHVNSTTAGIDDQNAAPDFVALSDYVPQAGVVRRIAASFSPTFAALSIDGGDALSIVPTSFTVDSIITDMTSSSIVHKETFYPLQQAADLPALSALT